MLDVITAADSRAWVSLTRAALATRRTEIDELNVFPVPDGDTGTNLYLTFDGALAQVAEQQRAEGIFRKATLVQEFEHFARASLLGARGNSGVILSQIIAGARDVVVEGSLEVLDADSITDVIRRGADLARRAVAVAVEGTILTVADATADAATAARAAGGTLYDVVSAAADEAHAALLRTPDQMPALAAAGVVDAGGAGYLLLLEALRRVVSGDWDVASDRALAAGIDLRRSGTHVLPTSSAPPQGKSTGLDVLDLHEVHGGGIGPAFEVMYLLSETDDARVQTLKGRLAALGDSLLVVGGPDVWNVHVHVDDVGAAIEAALEAGRPYRIKVTHFAEQVASLEARRAPSTLGTAVVACVAGPGIDAIMRAAGAVTVHSGPGARASAGALLAAARESRASSVVFLPNDKDTIMAAEVAAAAAENEGIDAHVIPSRTVVQGLAALAVHDPAANLRRCIVDMTAAAAATRHGAVTVASKEALTSGGHCHPGDALGIVDGDIVIVGGDLEGAAVQVLDRLLSAGGELVSLLRGAAAADTLIESVSAHLHRAWPSVEVSILEGGQPHYPLLVGVE